MITDPDVEAYAEAHSSAGPALLEQVAAVTRERFESRAGMMVGRIEGGLLAALVAIAQPRLVVEVGTFTGYSALSMARVLPPDARLVACEIDADHAAVAREHIEGSGFGDRIDLRVGPASDTLASLEGPVDLAFVDADKTGYAAYYESLLSLLSPTGCIVFDNVLWSGRVVADPSRDDGEDTRALRELNDRLVADDRVEVVMLPVRDGISIVRPRR